MDQAKYQEAQAAYDAGDYRTAAKAFLAAAGRGSIGNGSAYHMAGNSLMRLRRHADAVTVYGHALRDETYDRRGPVQANLGAAYAALGELSEAIAAYEAALEEPGYTAPHRAWQGIAAAEMDRGRAEDAAHAYRKAALEESNPDPGKALVNLGLCFMALGRPVDAIEAYQAALGFDNYAGRGKALANLGQAYVVVGDYAEAVRAFEKATQLHGHSLSPSARDAYDEALAATRAEREVVDGWETGEMTAVVATGDEVSGWDTGALAALAADDSTVQPAEEPPVMDCPEARAGTADTAAHAADALGFGDEAAVSEFFSRTEEDMRVQDREARRARREGGSGTATRVAIAAGVAVVVLLVIFAAGYFAGFGWPTQASTANGLFVAYSKGEAVDRYWVAVPDKDVAREMAKVPPIEDFTIGPVKRGRDTSTVQVAVVPRKGGEMNYIVTLDREGVGWRVIGIDNNWRSTGG